MKPSVELDFGSDLYNDLFIPRLTGFKFIDRDNASDKVELTFRNEDMLLLDWYPPGMSITFRFGWAEELSQPRTLKVKRIKFKGDSDLVVEGMSAEFEMDKVQKTRTFEDVNYAAVADYIAREQGYPIDLTYITDDDVIYDTVPQLGETDAHFLRRLSKELDYVFWADENEFHFHERDYGEKPRLLLELREGDLTGNIESLDGDLNLIRSPTKVKKKGYNPKKKKEVEATASGEDSGDTAGKYEPGEFPSAETVTGLLYNEKEGTFDPVYTVDGQQVVMREGKAVAIGPESTAQAKEEPTTAQDETEAKEKATKTLKKKKNKRLKFELTLTPGHPRYRAKVVAELRGARILDGPIYIKEAEHDVKEGDYTTKLKVIKGYLGKKPKKGAGASQTEETDGTPNEGQATGGFDTNIKFNDDGSYDVWVEERTPAPAKQKEASF